MPGRLFVDRCCGWETPVVLVVGVLLGMLAARVSSERNVAEAMGALSSAVAERDRVGNELNATQAQLTTAQRALQDARSAGPKCTPAGGEIFVDVGGNSPRMGEAWRILSGSFKIGREQ